MSGHIVFVRFFLGYHEPFPFDRFVHLDDNALGGALELLAKEWWNESANRDRIRKARIKQRKQLREQQNQLREWNEAGLAKPGRNSRNAGVPLAEVKEPHAKPSITPNFEEIAVVAGWGGGAACGVSHHGISHRYPVARFDSKDLADAAARAVQDRVEELARSAYTKERPGKNDAWYASTSPQFVVVAESELLLHDVVTAMEKLTRLEKPPTENQPLEEAFLRSYLPEIAPLLKQIETLHSPIKIPMQPNAPDEEPSPIGKPGRPLDSTKPKIVTRVRELRESTPPTPWKEIRIAIKNEFKKSLQVSTLQRYLREKTIG